MFLIKNWVVHNLLSHPLMEITYWLLLPLAGEEKSKKISGWIHDVSLPET